MEFDEVIRKRRMVRNYTSDPVPPEALDRIVDAGLRAPSAGYSQGMGFVVVTDAATRKSIAHLAEEEEYVASGFDPWISTAPAHIVITVSESIYRERYREPDKLGPDGEEIDWPVPYWWVDAGAAMMAVLLAAVNEGPGRRLPRGPFDAGPRRVARHPRAPEPDRRGDRRLSDA